MIGDVQLEVTKINKYGDTILKVKVQVIDVIVEAAI
jgi:hypothetical protein